MFKAQILRRSFSLFSRTPHARILRSATRDGHDTVQIQRVRLRKPFFTRSRLLGTVLITAGAFSFLRWLDEILEEVEEAESHSTPKLRRLNTEEKEEGQEVNDDEEDDDEDDEEDDDSLIFLPTGLSRPKPRTYYKGSDPEWQEFVRIAPDRKRMDRVRGELIALVRDLAARHPQYQLRLGNINREAGGVWIEFKFPDGPPIEFERPGIELTEDLSWRRTTRPVEELHHHRINDALVPTAAASALYSDSKRRAWQFWQDFNVYMGWRKAEPMSAQRLQNLLSQFPANPPATPGHPTPSSPSASSPTPSSAPSTDSAKQTQNTQSPTSSTSPPLGNPAYERFNGGLPNPSKKIRINPLLNLSHFRYNFRKEHKPHKIQPPRGTFIVTGLIEIIGDKARMTLDVTAAYDPKIGRYVTMKAQMRSVTDYRQTPKGGP